MQNQTMDDDYIIILHALTLLLYMISCLSSNFAVMTFNYHFHHRRSGTGVAQFIKREEPFYLPIIIVVITRPGVCPIADLATERASLSSDISI